MPGASESSVPLAPQKFTVQISVPLSLSHLGLWGPDFWDREYRVLHIFRADFPQWELVLGFFITTNVPCFNWAEPPNAVLLSVHWWWYGTLLNCLLSTCDGAAHCQVGLSVTLLKSYIRCCSFVKRNYFLYNFAVGHWVADLLLTVDVASLPPAIGPTLGANFWLSQALSYPHWKGSLSCTGPMAVDRDKGNLCCRMNIYFSGLGYGPEDSQIQLKRRLYKNEHIMRQW